METTTERTGTLHNTDDATARSHQRVAPLALDGAEFRTLGHDLVDRIAAFYDT